MSENIELPYLAIGKLPRGTYKSPRSWGGETLLIRYRYSELKEVATIAKYKRILKFLIAEQHLINFELSDLKDDTQGAVFQTTYFDGEFGPKMDGNRWHWEESTLYWLPKDVFIGYFHELDYTQLELIKPHMPN